MVPTYLTYHIPTLPTYPTYVTTSYFAMSVKFSAEKPEIATKKSKISPNPDPSTVFVPKRFTAADAGDIFVGFRERVDSILKLAPILKTETTTVEEQDE